MLQAIVLLEGRGVFEPEIAAQVEQYDPIPAWATFTPQLQDAGNAAQGMAVGQRHENGVIFTGPYVGNIGGELEVRELGEMWV
jgi:hypothetical protein